MEPIYHSYLEIPFFSFLNGVILLIGFFYVGEYIKKIFKLDIILNDISVSYYQNILVSSVFFQLILLPICLFVSFSNLILILVSIITFLIGIYGIFKKFYLLKNLLNLKFKISVDTILIAILIIGFFLLASAPVTNIDSLDYHLFSAKYLLNNGSFVTDITNFHSSRLFGSGEILISLGLVVGSEQFGSLLQFSGILCIIGIFKKYKVSNFFYLLLLSSPVLIFFISSLKPQLFSIFASGFAYSLIFYKRFNLKKFDSLDIKRIIIILLILFANTQIKFSFYLGSSLLIMFLFIRNFEIMKIFQFIKIIPLLYLLIILPTIIWKYLTFGGNFFELIYSPVSTDLYGLDYFKNYLTALSESNIYWFIFPTSFSNFTHSLGIGSLMILGVILTKNKVEKYQFLFLIFLFTLITYFFGQFTSRFFYEAYVWIILFLVIFNKDFKINKLYNYTLKLQTLVVIGATLYGVIFFTPGIINSEIRDKVLERHASGYKFFKWVNKNLENSNSPILVFDRSISFSKNHPIARDHIFFVNMSDLDAEAFVNEIKDYNPKFLVFTTDSTSYKKYLGCTDKIFKHEQNFHMQAIRNPLSKSNQKFDAYIYEFNADLLPGCVNPNKVDLYSR